MTPTAAAGCSGNVFPPPRLSFAARDLPSRWHRLVMGGGGPLGAANTSARARWCLGSSAAVGCQRNDKDKGNGGLRRAFRVPAVATAVACWPARFPVCRRLAATGGCPPSLLSAVTAAAPSPVVCIPLQPLWASPPPPPSPAESRWRGIAASFSCWTGHTHPTPSARWPTVWPSAATGLGGAAVGSRSRGGKTAVADACGDAPGHIVPHPPHPPPPRSRGRSCLGAAAVLVLQRLQGSPRAAWPRCLRQRQRRDAAPPAGRAVVHPRSSLQ